jgi:glycosyltransferase involved in cell wall biosynthesis
MRIAFYAPLKPPGHPVPSGDRTVARLLMRALRAGGHEVTLASAFRSYSATPDSARLAALRGQGAAIRAGLLTRYRDIGPPELWFSYHPYYKAPDFLGPGIAALLGIPYVTAEASHAAKRRADAWAPWQAAVEPGLRQAALHFCPTPRDRAGLATLLGADAPLFMLPPFLDSTAIPRPPMRPETSEVRLVCVAMMRQSNKRDSYLFLAEALHGLDALPWRLDIVGDGPAEAEIAAAFAPFGPERVRLRGQLTESELQQSLAEAHLFVWPGVREAYGMSFLHAAAMGVPALATHDGGVPAVVVHGRTGLLTPAGDVAAFRAALARLIGDHALLHRLGREAAIFARRERSLAGAARLLSAALNPLVRGAAA